MISKLQNITVGFFAVAILLLFTIKFLRFAITPEPEDDKRPPFGLAGFACLVSFAVVYYSAEFLHSQFVFGQGRLLVYLLTPIAVAFIILYRSSLHREFTVARRICALLLSACLVVGVTMFFGGLVVATFLFFTHGPPIAGKL